ncbi:hypothetical protein EV182_000683 [Spiromyces aspiralis]|uniref:Uncharacterized protein n=1 Tax=Spiromyces aspiralis TaxID=68401 RepID=A0ACC1HXY7_9FUNG|nr:hypothetical protein EV182_000683 [Spiromyces aspiralis]
MLDKFLCNIAGQRVLGTMEKITTTADTTADAEVDGHDTDSDGYEPQRNAPCIPDRVLRCQQQPRYLATAKITTVALSEPPQGQRSVRNAMSQLVRWYIEEDEEASCSGSHQPLPLEEAARQSRRPLDKPKSTVFSTANIRDRRRRVVERGRPQFYRIQN